MSTLDWIGAILLAICFSSLIVGLSYVQQWGLLSVNMGLAAVLFLTSAEALARTETRNAHPILDPALFRIRLFVFSVASAVLLFIGLFFNSTFRTLNGGRDMNVYTPALESVFMASFQRAMLVGAAVVGLGIVVAYLRGWDSGRRVEDR